MNKKLCSMCMFFHWDRKGCSEGEHAFWQRIAKDESERVNKKGERICVLTSSRGKMWTKEPPNDCPWLLEHTVTQDAE